MFAIEQCLLVLTHHPAVWHQAAQFLDHSSKALNEKGVRKTSLLLRISFENQFGPLLGCTSFKIICR